MGKSQLSDHQVLLAMASYRLLYGPYIAPNVRVGDELLCSVYGLQVVMGWHGPKQWPQAKATGRPRLIVCGGLLEALSQETARTISLHWGVHVATIAKWRKRLGLHLRPPTANSEFKSARMRVDRVSRPESFVTPGSGNLSNLSQAERRRIALKAAGDHAWSPEEIEVLRHLSNRAASKELNRSMSSIANARRRFHLKSPTKAHTCRHCGYSWLSFKSEPPRYCPNHACGCRIL